MIYTELGSTGLRSSVLGFGCAPLLGRAGRRESLAALENAYEHGITFFDTARSYGYGEGEALLGEFLQGHRDKVLLATKFGIVPAQQTLIKRVAKPIIRGVLSLLPSARGLVQAGTRRQFHEGQFTVPVLRRSIEQSLRKLRTEYIDILFLHAAPAAALENDDLMREMEKLIQAGTLRAAGLSAEPEVIELALRRGISPLTSMQFPCNVFDLSMTEKIATSPSTKIAFLANHPFGGVMRAVKTRQILRAFVASQDTPVELREKIASVNDSVVADIVLNVITRNTGIHVVIPAMIRPDHVRENSIAVSQSRFSPSEVQWLRTRISGAL
jgi:aryl-alcohol dehydrogenase-like predicted oxidoreductase